LCAAAFLVDFAGAGCAGFLAVGLCAGFFTTGLAALLAGALAADFARTGALDAGLRAAGFLTGRAAAGFFAAGFFAAGLCLEFAMLFTTLSLRGRVL
jgi:hypothetical protein